MKKYFLGMLIAVMMIGTVAGCGNTETSAPTESQNVENTEVSVDTSNQPVEKEEKPGYSAYCAFGTYADSIAEYNDMTIEELADWVDEYNDANPIITKDYAIQIKEPTENRVDPIVDTAFWSATLMNANNAYSHEMGWTSDEEYEKKLTLIPGYNTTGDATPIGLDDPNKDWTTLSFGFTRDESRINVEYYNTVLEYAAIFREDVIAYGAKPDSAWATLPDGYFESLMK